MGERFARAVTVATGRAPWLWPLLRAPLRRMFDRLAPEWDTGASASRLTAYDAGLALVPTPPRTALDLGTGTGSGAFHLAARWPHADVLGVDLSPGMVAEARANTPPELADRVRFEVADAQRLPLDDAAVDVVAMNNMIPFARELARVVAPGGYLVVAFSRGPRTPIFVPPDRLRRELERAGLVEVREVAAAPGLALVARRPPVP